MNFLSCLNLGIAFLFLKMTYDFIRKRENILAILIAAFIAMVNIADVFQIGF